MSIEILTNKIYYKVILNKKIIKVDLIKNYNGDFMKKINFLSTISISSAIFSVLLLMLYSSFASSMKKNFKVAFTDILINTNTFFFFLISILTISLFLYMFEKSQIKKKKETSKIICYFFLIVLIVSNFLSLLTMLFAI